MADSAAVAKPDPRVAWAEAIAELLEPKRYAGRIYAVYVALGLVLAGAVSALVLTLTARPATPWSQWSPQPGSLTRTLDAIARKVGTEYRLGDSQGELTKVVPKTKPAVTVDGEKHAVSVILVAPRDPSRPIVQITPSSTAVYALCGDGPYCSIASGHPSLRRGRLVRREGLELALDTLKFEPRIDGVLVLLPPPPGLPPSTAVFLQRSHLRPELTRPLRETLPVNPSPVPGSPDTIEAARIDQLTLPAFDSYRFTELQTGGAALVLEPIKETSPLPTQPAPAQ